MGIDSIKRVEILGGLTESLNGHNGDLQEKLELEKLAATRSLRGILEYLDEALFREGNSAESDSHAVSPSPAASPDAAADEQHPEAGDTETDTHEIQRALVKVVESPLAATSSPRLPSGAVLLTDDGRGVARQIADRFADFGQAAVIIGMSAGNEEATDSASADLTDPHAVRALVERLREETGGIAGLIHCQPLAALDDSLDLVALARRDVKSLYLLARELERDLVEAGQNGNAVMLAATALGGTLGYGQRYLPAGATAAHGGILGLMKCIGLEWPDVLVRAIDVDGELPSSQIADCLLRELGEPKGPFEVGYDNTKRVTWEPTAAPLDTTDEKARSLLPTGATVLVTGGARGITAEIATQLAAAYQPRMILVGSSPTPPDDECESTAGLNEPADVKKALMERLAETGQQVQPAEVEASYRQLLREREIRDNLARLKSTGAEVEYHSVDVRDRDALSGLIADIVKRCGQIDGVVHGAGVIDDKLLRDKTPESFDRVFGVKVESATALSELLDFEQLSFCVFFASIASRYGNRGQADYAAANEVLSKLALDLDRRCQARVFSVVWGPWAQVGMVADLEKHLSARGVALIDPGVGASKFIEELEFGWKGEGEVLIAGGAQHVTKPPVRSSEQLNV